MYAWAVEAKYVPDDLQVDPTDAQLGEWHEHGMHELWYWRKHHDLHGWMHHLYNAKNGSSKQFNCNYVRLTEKDLQALEDTLLKNELPPTTGFFFGDNAPDADSTENDKRFIQAAREALRNGQAVFYNSWW